MKDTIVLFHTKGGINMWFTSNGTYCSSNTFRSKNDTPLYSIKVHSEETEEYLVMYTNKDVYERSLTIGKRTPVKLTVNITDKYVNLTEIEPLKQK